MNCPSWTSLIYYFPQLFSPRPQPSLPVTSAIPVKPRLPMRNPAPITSAEPSCRTAAFLNAASTSSSKGSQMQNGSKPEKPNSLPVLNCLFAALNKQRGQAESDDTSPYTLNQPKVLLRASSKEVRLLIFPCPAFSISMSLSRYLTSCT